jgi:hypothetical protein
MWQAYVKFISLFQAKPTDPDDPRQQHAVGPEELAIVVLLVLSFWAGCVTGMCSVLK